MAFKHGEFLNDHVTTSRENQDPCQSLTVMETGHNLLLFPRVILAVNGAICSHLTQRKKYIYQVVSYTGQTLSFSFVKTKLYDSVNL